MKFKTDKSFNSVYDEKKIDLHEVSKENRFNKSENKDDLRPFYLLNEKSFLTYDRRLNNSGKREDILKGVRTNKGFHLLRSKKLSDIHSKLKDVSLDELGGNYCCQKLKRNYEIDLTHSHVLNNYNNKGTVNKKNRTISADIAKTKLNNFEKMKVLILI